MTILLQDDHSAFSHSHEHMTRKVNSVIAYVAGTRPKTRVNVLPARLKGVTAHARWQLSKLADSCNTSPLAIGLPLVCTAQPYHAYCRQLRIIAGYRAALVVVKG